MKTLQNLFQLLISTIIALTCATFIGDFITLPKVPDIIPWGPFFTVFGVIYAIIAGFLLVDVLSRFGDLTQTFEGELNAVEDVRDFLIYLDGDQEEVKRSIRKELHEFVRSVAEKEWPNMTRRKKSLNSDTSKELYDVMRAVNQIKVTNQSDSIALTSLIRKLSDITTLRTKRITLANECLPPQLKLLLGFMSLILVGSFILLSAEPTIVHYMMITAVTGAVHLLYIIITDLDHPFKGQWNIDKSLLIKLKDDFAQFEEKQTD